MSLPPTARRLALQHGLAGLAAATGLLGCANNAPLRDEGAPFPATPSGWREPLDAGASWLRILVFRAGAAAHLGHNHVIEAGDLQAALVWRDEAAARARRWPEATLTLDFSLNALVMDRPLARAAQGPAFASVLSDADRAGTLANLRRALAAERFGRVRVQSTRIVGEGPLLAVTAAIEWHGQVRTQTLAVQLQGNAAQGRAVLRQSDFGIQPFSVLGGLLAVQDEVVVEFGLTRAASS
jgi:YceI-like domain